MHFYTNHSVCALPLFNLFCIYNLIYDLIFIVILSTNGPDSCASFRASFKNYELTSYCSNFARQHIYVETCTPICAHFLPVCHQLNESCSKKLPSIRLQQDIIIFVMHVVQNDVYFYISLGYTNKAYNLQFVPI